MKHKIKIMEYKLREIGKIIRTNKMDSMSLKRWISSSLYRFDKNDQKLIKAIKFKVNSGNKILRSTYAFRSFLANEWDGESFKIDCDYFNKLIGGLK